MPQIAPLSAHTCRDLTGPSRDETSLIVTQCLGLPPLYPTVPLSVHYALNLFYYAQKPVLIALSRTLILLLLSSSSVEVNPGPVFPQALSFVDFCNLKSLGFMNINIRSLLPKFVLFTALVHSNNPLSESWLRKAIKNSEISIPNYNLFRQGRTAKGGGIAIYCRESLQSSVFTIQVCAQAI